MDKELKDQFSLWLLSVSKIFEQLALSLAAETDRLKDLEAQRERAWKHGKIY